MKPLTLNESQRRAVIAKLAGIDKILYNSQMKYNPHSVGLPTARSMVAELQDLIGQSVPDQVEELEALLESFSLPPGQRSVVRDAFARLKGTSQPQAKDLLTIVLAALRLK